MEYSTLQEFVSSFEESKNKLESVVSLSADVSSEDELNMFEEEISQELIFLNEFVKEQQERLVVTAEDKESAIVEINSGAGGTEAQDFAQMLMTMYIKFGAKNGYSVEILDELDGTVAGIKSCALLIEGKGAFGKLKGESGVHRIQRNSPYNAQNKRQTSFASVHVIPLIKDQVKTGSVVLRDTDYEVQRFRSGGKGGQNVNKVESAVRVIHKESGIVVVCRNERDQHVNLKIALDILKTKLIKQREEKQKQEFDEKFNAGMQDVSFGHQIRTYSFNPDLYIKEERTRTMFHAVDKILDGNLNDLIEKHREHLLGQKLKELQSTKV